MRRFQSTPFNPGNKVRVAKESIESSIRFKVHKFTCRKRPNPKNVVIFPVFSEFGTETLVPLLCLPQLLRRKYAGRYAILVGWHGREFMYRHLVDEYWELSEEHQNLREYCRAFHHESRNLKKFEKELQQYGKVIDIQEMASVAIFPKMDECPVVINNYKCKGQVVAIDDAQFCVKCGVRFNPIGAFYDIKKAKRLVRWLPSPSPEKLQAAKELIPPNAVGIVGRARKCYGRNLDSAFYASLIRLVTDLGYNVVWMGEKGVSLACPSSSVLDYTSLDRSWDFEFTLACVKQMAFTVQFWTASTRLAGFVGTPFLLFESPDQIWGGGHEGYRINLCSSGPKKIVASHFINVLNNPCKALNIVKDCVYEMEEGHYNHKIGLVDHDHVVRNLILANNSRVGF